MIQLYFCKTILYSSFLQTLQDQLVDYQPKLTMLKQTCEQLRTLGQSASSEELLRLTAEYEELTQQIALQKTKLIQAVDLREIYHGNKGEVETKLRQMEEQVAAVDVQGVPVHTKLDRYKVSVYLYMHSLYGGQKRLRKTNSKRGQFK